MNESDDQPLGEYPDIPPEVMPRPNGNIIDWIVNNLL